jgi:hypothetical protein
MLPETAPLKDQLAEAIGVVSTTEGLVSKYEAQGKRGLFGSSVGKGLSGGKDAAKQRYKLKIARAQLEKIKKRMEPAPVAKKPQAPATPALDKDAIKTRAFGTEQSQAAAEKTDTQKEIFDLGVQGVTAANDGKDLVKDIMKAKKAGGLIEARDGGGFGDIQQIVKFALAVRYERANTHFLFPNTY